MIEYAIVASRGFTSELSAKRAYIAGQADASVADRYLDLIESRCGKLSYLPHRGTPRDDLAPGVRTISIRNSATVAYVVVDKQVVLLHIAFRGQDIARLFG